MSDVEKQSGGKEGSNDEQSAETTEANKPQDARVKDKPEAGNILGGVQPKS